MRLRLTWLAVALALLAGAAPAAADSPEVLRVSAIPDENPTVLLRVYTPFAE